MELFGTMGKEEKLLPGKERVLFEAAGGGTLTHMWFGGSWPGWGDTRIRIYVDGEKEAGIDMALFLGHGIGWNDDAAPWGTKRIGKTGRPSGVYNTYRIPFGDGIKITAQLSAQADECDVLRLGIRVVMATGRSYGASFSRPRAGRPEPTVRFSQIGDNFSH
jgi:hypothetical protein